MSEPRGDIGVIGGSGFYSFLEDAEEVSVDTPYGPPSGPFAVGVLRGRRVAFLARHGATHHLPPHQVNYRANMWAMHSLGVRRVFAPCAAGSLDRTIAPGDFVVLDQLIDRTSGRADTYIDGAPVGHASFADPYCPALRANVLRGAADLGFGVHNGGTMVVVQGPRFSTRAESRWFQNLGAQVVGMTQYPEAILARELGMCYSGIALITDYDVGLSDDESIEPVTMDAVLSVMNDNVERVSALLRDAVEKVPVTNGSIPADCSCRALGVVADGSGVD